MHSDVEDILESTRVRAESAEQVFESIEPRDIEGGVSSKIEDGLNPVIAEVKPTSPTKDSDESRDLVDIAESMVAGGAVAVSVLTEPDHFSGDLDTLREIRDAVDVPVLRKDFILNESQLREVETDIILLISKFLDDVDSMIEEAHRAGMNVLLETHTEDEVMDAIESDADLIGVNNRDLAELNVDMEVGESLLPLIPKEKIAVAESGISSKRDAARMRLAGADALLIGTSIMEAEDVEEKTRFFVNA